MKNRLSSIAVARRASGSMFRLLTLAALCSSLSACVAIYDVSRSNAVELCRKQGPADEYLRCVNIVHQTYDLYEAELARLGKPAPAPVQ